MAGQASGEKPPRATSHAQKFRESEKENKQKKRARRPIRQKKNFYFSKQSQVQFTVWHFIFFFTALLRNPTNCIVAALNGPAPFPPLLPACTSVVSNADIIGDILECMISIRLKLTDIDSVIHKSVHFE